MSYRLRLSRPALKLKVNTRIPAQMIGGTGIAITRASGIYTFDLDYDELGIITSYSDALEATTYLASWESVGDTFSKISIADFKTDLTATLGLLYQPLDADLTALAGLTSAADKLPYFTGSGTASLADFSAYGRTLVDDADATTARATLGLVIGTNVQAFDADLSALAANSTDGLWAHTGVGTGAARTLTAPAAGLTISNPAGIAGNPTFAFANDLAALEALSGTNTIYYRSAADTWTAVTIGTNLTFSAGILAASGGGSSTVVQPQGRLTLTTGVSVTTADVSGSTNVYYTPCISQFVPIYNGSSFAMTDTGGELTLALDSTAAHTNYHQSGKNYDFFIINDGGTIRLGTGPKWDDGAVAGSATARGTGAASTELQLLKGIWTNKNTITIRFGSASGNTVSVAANQATYVGSGRMVADGQISDTALLRFLYNEYNQAVRTLLVTESTASWSYSTLAFQQARASTANQVAVLRGNNSQAVEATVIGTAGNSTASGQSVVVGVGIDSSTVNSARSGVNSCTSGINAVPTAVYNGYPGLGYHEIRWLERGAGADTQAWFGNTIQTGLSGWTLG